MALTILGVGLLALSGVACAGLYVLTRPQEDAATLNNVAQRVAILEVKDAERDTAMSALATHVEDSLGSVKRTRARLSASEQRERERQEAAPRPMSRRERIAELERRSGGNGSMM